MAGRRINPRSARSLAEARTGLFRATLLFGSAMVALALIVVPEADRRAKNFAAGNEVDATVTGSIAATPDVLKRYTQRRSVLDLPEREPCLLFPDGTQRGSC